MSMSNNIVSFPFPGDQIKDWCKILKEERPDVTIEQLKNDTAQRDVIIQDLLERVKRLEMHA